MVAEASTMTSQDCAETGGMQAVPRPLSPAYGAGLVVLFFLCVSHLYLARGRMERARLFWDESALSGLDCLA